VIALQHRPRLWRLALISLALSAILLVGPALLPCPNATVTDDLRWAVFLTDMGRYLSTLLGTFAAALAAVLLVTNAEPNAPAD
jgi:hypothetical protein